MQLAQKIGYGLISVARHAPICPFFPSQAHANFRLSNGYKLKKSEMGISKRLPRITPLISCVVAITIGVEARILVEADDLGVIGRE